MRNLRMILMSIMTMFMITNVNSQTEFNLSDLTVEMDGFTSDSYSEYKTPSSTNLDPKTRYVNFKIDNQLLNFSKVNVTLSFGMVINEDSEYKMIVNDQYEVIIDKSDFTDPYFGSISVQNISVDVNGIDVVGDFLEVKLISDDGYLGVEVINFEGLVITENTDISSVSKNDISNDFNVYTYNNNLIVKTDDYNTQYEVSVHNMNGQMVMSEKNNGGMETYLQVPNGIYIVDLSTDKGVVRKKIAVQ